MVKVKTYLFLIVILISCNTMQKNISNDKKELSLMTFNIRYNNPKDNENNWEHRKNDVINLINNYRPDILGIQEGRSDQVWFIEKNISHYKRIGLGRNGTTKGEYSCIFYDSGKLKLIEHNTIWLSETPSKVSIGWDASTTRICTYGAFVYNRKKDTIHVFNTHFDRSGRIAKEKSAELILSKINEFGLNDSKVVVMGDLNSLPNTNPIKKLENNLADAQKISEQPLQGPQGTFNYFRPNYTPKSQIDYIFIKNLKVKSYMHIDDKTQNNRWLSDHLPVMVEITK